MVERTSIDSKTHDALKEKIEALKLLNLEADYIKATSREEDFVLDSVVCITKMLEAKNAGEMRDLSEDFMNKVNIYRMDQKILLEKRPKTE